MACGKKYLNLKQSRKKSNNYFIKFQNYKCKNKMCNAKGESLKRVSRSLIKIQTRKIHKIISYVRAPQNICSLRHIVSRSRKIKFLQNFGSRQVRRIYPHAGASVATFYTFNSHLHCLACFHSRERDFSEAYCRREKSDKAG